jgi:hypothetical protein
MSSPGNPLIYITPKLMYRAGKKAIDRTDNALRITLIITILWPGNRVSNFLGIAIKDTNFKEYSSNCCW